MRLIKIEPVISDFVLGVGFNSAGNRRGCNGNDKFGKNDYLARA